MSPYLSDLYLLAIIKVTRPRIAESIEPIIMPILLTSTNDPGGKERPAINILMVNPMPPSMLAPIMCNQVTPPKRGTLNNFDPAKVKIVIPSGFPNTRLHLALFGGDRKSVV